MTERVIAAGSGGQGIMLLGKILATAALKNKLNVTWFPSYGAEVRGGAAFCMVVISSSPISSPYIDTADSLIIMNEPSLSRFQRRVEQEGLLLVNSSLVKFKSRAAAGTQAFFLPFTSSPWTREILSGKQPLARGPVNS